MKPVEFHVLLALLEGDQHGYRVMKDLERRSGGRVRVGPATLYDTIGRLEKAGMLAEARERPDPELDDRRRKYYRLTRFGKRVLRAESERLAELISFARANLADVGE